jgi:hypothetical protein
MESVATAMAAELESATGLGVGRVLAPVFGEPVVQSD